MSALWIIVFVLIIALIGFIVGRTRAMASADGNIRNLHSLPSYYGWNVAMFAVVPGLLVLLLWMLVQPAVINTTVAPIAAGSATLSAGELDLAMSDVRRVAEGLDTLTATGTKTAAEVAALTTDTNIKALLGTVGVAIGSDVTPDSLAAAQTYRVMSARGGMLMAALVLAVAICGAAYAVWRTNRDFRARNTVEVGIKFLLIGSALIAILTTVGIVLALVFNTVRFFELYPAADFFFGTVWSPSFGGGSSLGILPLVWGTLYISAIALAVAVPVGIFSAIYLAEYATPTMRAYAKPMLEVLAGIPTIVYGLFALLTIGPGLEVVEAALLLEKVQPLRGEHVGVDVDYRHGLGLPMFAAKG